MRLLRALSIGAALTLGSVPAAFAQTPAKPADPVLVTPVLFPVEAKFAFLDFQRVASDSVSGQARDADPPGAADEEGRRDRSADQGAPGDDVAAGRGGPERRGPRATDEGHGPAPARNPVLAAERRGGIPADADRAAHRLRKTVTPVVEEIAKEKGLHAVFAADAGIAFYINPALDISGEVIKRLDGQPKK